MKKYPITFTCYFDNPYNSEIFLEKNKDRMKVVEKWKGKEITILEMESLIDEFEKVVFDGKNIEVYNFYRE